MKKLFSISLKDRSWEGYTLLDDSHLLDWKELMSLFYFKFYPLHEIHQDRNFIYNFWPCDGENIAQAWGRLKTLTKVTSTPGGWNSSSLFRLQNQGRSPSTNISFGKVKCFSPRQWCVRASSWCRRSSRPSPRNSANSCLAWGTWVR